MQSYLKKVIKQILNVQSNHWRLTPDNTGDIEYQVGRALLRLPGCHQLPVYQCNHSKYDRFLPHLASYLPSEAIVIDVGANCGDTVAAMVSVNNKLSFLCIEADSDFYSYLVDNINRIQLCLGGIAIKAVKSFVGREILNARLIGTGGTKKAVLADSGDPNAVKSQTLDSIIESAQTDATKVFLLKTDTDGYDYDVISSAQKLISSSEPIIFFECQPDTEAQKNGYLALTQDLASLGYCHWSVFDNYGALVFRTSDEAQLKDLIVYLWSQACRSTTRTFYYIDVLASTPKNIRLLDNCLAAY